MTPPLTDPDRGKNQCHPRRTRRLRPLRYGPRALSALAPVPGLPRSRRRREDRRCREDQRNGTPRARRRPPRGAPRPRAARPRLARHARATAPRDRAGDAADGRLRCDQGDLRLDQAERRRDPGRHVGEDADERADRDLVGDQGAGDGGHLAQRRGQGPAPPRRSPPRRQPAVPGHRRQDGRREPPRREPRRTALRPRRDRPRRQGAPAGKSRRRQGDQGASDGRGATAAARRRPAVKRALPVTPGPARPPDAPKGADAERRPETARRRRRRARPRRRTSRRPRRPSQSRRRPSRRTDAKAEPPRRRPASDANGVARHPPAPRQAWPTEGRADRARRRAARRRAASRTTFSLAWSGERRFLRSPLRPRSGTAPRHLAVRGRPGRPEGVGYGHGY